MRPFNLQEAIDGKPLITRGGKKVLDFHYFKAIKGDSKIYVLIEGNDYPITFHIDGMFAQNIKTEYDLFMYEEPKTYYANVYRYSDDMIQISDGFLSKDNIIKNGGNSKNYVKTIEITI